MLAYVTNRKVIKIAVTATGKAALERVADRYGMKEFIAGGKIFDWFAQQDDIFQRAVLGMMEGIEVDAARAFMERLASGKPEAGTKQFKGDQVPPLKPTGRGRRPGISDPPARPAGE